MAYSYNTRFKNPDGSDIGLKYVSKEYMIDVYPGLVGNKAGGLYSSGDGTYGKLGNGLTSNKSSPVKVALGNFIVIGGGTDFRLAINIDGTLWSWGRNNSGQLGQGNTIDLSSPVKVGANTDWRFVSSQGDAFDGANSNNSTFGIKTDGTLWSWGDNSKGRLGQGNTTSLSSPVKVGANTNWSYVTCASHTMAIKTDGTLWSWGDNSKGQLGQGNTTDLSSPVQVGANTNWKYVVTNINATIAIKTDGTLWGWGNNMFGMLGLGDTADRSSPVQVGANTDWKSISSCYYATAGTKTNGTLWSWGYNGYGQLGVGNNIHKSSPIQVGSLTNWKSVSGCVGPNFSAIKTDGTLWAWGYNTSGELGVGDTTVRSSPTQVGILNTWKTSKTFPGIMAIKETEDF